MFEPTFSHHPHLFSHSYVPHLSLEEVKAIPPSTLLSLINRAKKALKSNEIYLDLVKEHSLNKDAIDLIPMRFGDLPVSARTSAGIITLNYKLLMDGEFVKDYSYILHELQHAFSQCFGAKPTQGADDGDYLSNKEEQKGFQRQIQYIDQLLGEDEVKEYLDQLLDHHDKSGKEREELKDKLTEKIDD